MTKETLYLDTSVPSAYYDEGAKERQKETIKFFSEKIKDYEVYLSDVTIAELEENEEPLRGKLLYLVKDFIELPTTEEVVKLADTYIENGIIPKNHKEDALHIAIATVNKIEIVTSWNLEHIVKLKTRREVNATNILKGYKTIEIVLPSEL